MKPSKFYIGIAIALLVLLAGAAWLWLSPEQAGRESLHPSKVFVGTAKNSGSIGKVGSDTTSFQNIPTIIPKNTPVVTGFVGDLQLKGNPQGDGTIQPFVVGESLKLQADALNAVEYRWAVNGEVIKEKGQEWSARPDREYDVNNGGLLTFTVQVRGADKDLLSQEKGVGLNILPLKIMSLSKAIIHEDDERFVTGETLNLEVEMATAMRVDPDAYLFRYFVNDVPIKHPDDDQEWTPNDTLTYTFSSPGTYAFKVEARRPDKPTAEDSMELPETVVAADAVLLSFDSNLPSEKAVPVGTQVYLSAFPTSRYGKSECRIGTKKINAADFNWIRDDAGAQWGDPYRTWVPVEPGTYVVRCEIREIGKEAADDFRELVFTVIDGNF